MYGGVSAEDRRSERRRRLLDAGLELIAADGWSATSVRRVCQQAGLSSRFFYESFDSLDALGVAIVDEIAENTVAALVGALDSDEPQQVRVRAAVDALIRTLTDDPRTAKVAFIEALGSEPVMKRRLVIMRSVAEILVQEYRRQFPDVGDDQFAQLAAFGLVGLVVELMIVWASGELATTREQLVEDLGDLILANIDGAVTIALRRGSN
jgi:AcrR family transcriptional regulator